MNYRKRLALVLRAALPAFPARAAICALLLFTPLVLGADDAETEKTIRMRLAVETLNVYLSTRWTIERVGTARVAFEMADADPPKDSCNPEHSRSDFQGIRDKLSLLRLQLLAAMGFQSDVYKGTRLDAVDVALQRLEKTQAWIWSDTPGNENIAPKERCLDFSEVVGTLRAVDDAFSDILGSLLGRPIFPEATE